MRKVVSGLYISVDGVVESPEKWQFDHFDSELMAELAATITAADAVLLGRVTYQAWEGYWPNSQAEPFASFINNSPKYVVSTTLREVGWKNSFLIKGGLAEEINRIKQQPGKNIAVTGSPSLVLSLLENDLLDELTLMVIPVIVGSGKRLFKADGELQRLKLTGSKISSSGVAILTYQPRRYELAQGFLDGELVAQLRDRPG